MTTAHTEAQTQAASATDLPRPVELSDGTRRWTPWPASSGVARNVVVALIFLAGYVALERLSFLHEYKGLPTTPWNPGLGMMFALMVMAGAPAAILLFAGVVIAEFVVLESNLGWPVIAAIGAIISLSYGAAAAIARRRLKLDVSLAHLRDVLALLALGVGGAVVVAVLLTALLVAIGHLAIQETPAAATSLVVGDIIGVGVMTPLFLRFAFLRHDIRPDRVVAMIPEVALYVALIVFSLWAVGAGGSADGFKFFYLFFIPVVAAAVRHGLDGACLGLAATQFGLVGLLHLHGYDARAFIEFQTLMFVLTATGLIVGVVVSERENADRLMRVAEARLREKEAEAAQAARLSLVSSMASALAHEISQPMTAARALGRSAQHIVRMPGGDLPRADANLTGMIAQIDHAGDVVRRMRDFLRRGRPHVSTIDVNAMLADALALARAESAAKRIAIELHVADDTPSIHGDRVQLQQVVLNLVRNAMDAMASQPRSDGRVRVTAKPAAAGDIEIIVADNGPGVDSELATRLFEPLLTSKQEGLGLGLSICASIVASHNGRIWLASGKPGATEFRVSLPIEQP